MVKPEREQIITIFGAVGTLDVLTMPEAIAIDGRLTMGQVEAILRLVAEDRAWLWIYDDGDLAFRVLNGGEPKP